MKNKVYIKEILVIIVLSIILGVLRNILMIEPLPLLKEKKTLNNIEGISIPEKLDEPMSIDLDLAYKLFNDKALFIDARAVEDYVNGHIENSVNIPYDEIESYEDDILDFNVLLPVVIYCSGGECELSMHLGDMLFDDYEFEKVLIFEAGFPAWEEAGYPIKW